MGSGKMNKCHLLLVELGIRHFSCRLCPFRTKRVLMRSSRGVNDCNSDASFYFPLGNSGERKELEYKGTGEYITRVNITTVYKAWPGCF